ncbi:MAG: hypothetical protein J7J68_07015 [Thermotogaceae bacterium]|nr:hypothetical protein [Thermotogaceae bacterium]
MTKVLLAVMGISLFVCSMSIFGRSSKRVAKQTLWIVALAVVLFLTSALLSYIFGGE